MGFIIFMFVVLLVIFLLQFYFFSRLHRSLLLLFPKLDKNRSKKIRRYFIFYINIFPVVGLAIAAWIRFNNIKDFLPPENLVLDLLFIFPFWIFVFILVQSIIYLIPGDIVRLLTRLLFKRSRKSIEKYFAVFFLFIVGISAVYVLYRVPYDFNMVETRQIVFQKDGLPEILQNFKIAHVSDIQADHFTSGKRIDNYLDLINEADPDLILIAGDIITSTPKYIGYAGKKLNRLDADYGVFSCIGDHDNWAYRHDYPRSVKEITDSLAVNGVTMKDNDNLIISVDSAKIGLTFITHTYSNRIDQEDLELLVNGTDTLDLKILLTHQPRQFLIDEAIKNKYDLFLAGHTHGGQVSFLFPFITLTPTLIETFYVKGDFYFDQMLMVVNRGLGMSIAPLRYNSTPEITIIILK